MTALLNPTRPVVSSLQDQADAILARAVMTVCDGWPKGVHPRRVLKVGDPARAEGIEFNVADGLLL